MRFQSKQCGVAAVELALILPVLVLLIFGTYQFGRSMSYYNAMVKSVRDGARHLTFAAPGDTVKIDEAKCLIVYGSTTGSPNCSGTPLVPGLQLNMVSVCDRISCPADHNLQSIAVPGSATVGTANLVTVKITGYSAALTAANFYGPNLFTFSTRPISETFIQVL